MLPRLPPPPTTLPPPLIYDREICTVRLEAGQAAPSPTAQAYAMLSAPRLDQRLCCMGSKEGGGGRGSFAPEYLAELMEEKTETCSPSEWKNIIERKRGQFVGEEQKG